jgi:dTDP-4-amino-4,6-dideoxygalactose transaminase
MTQSLLNLPKLIAKPLQRQHCVLTGRGTTALYLALRTIARKYGLGEVILPDMLCSAALEGVLLAGFTPIFGEVLPGRLTISPASVADLVGPRTRAVLVAHLFGHVVDVDAIRDAAPGIPIIEDAVQGLGGSFKGRPVGTLGDLSFTSFDSTKMVGGRTGALLFDDDRLCSLIQSELRELDSLPEPPLEALNRLLEPQAAAAYAGQLWAASPTLLRPFDPSPENIERIVADWSTLPDRVRERNTKAVLLREGLAGLPLTLPEINDGDAIWRYTLTSPTMAVNRWIMRSLQRANLPGSSLYYPLSRFFGQQTTTPANRTINLWVDGTTSEADIRHILEVITTGPFYN